MELSHRSGWRLGLLRGLKGITDEAWATSPKELLQVRSVEMSRLCS